MKRTGMKNKKVIMLLSNPCIIDPRVELEASALSEAGFEVEIVAWDRLCNCVGTEARGNYKITRIRVRSGYSRGLRQLFALLPFYFRAYRYIKRQGKAGVIHCHDLDTLPIGYLYKLFHKAMLVYDAHEIYSEMVFKNTILKKISMFFEKMMLEKTDAFFTVGEVRKEWYEQKRYSKIPLVLGNYKQTGRVKVNVPNEKKKLGIGRKLLVLYMGSLNEERMIIELVKAVGNDKRFYLYIAGNGTRKDEIVSEIEKTDNAGYLGFIDDPAKIDYYNSVCDVIYYGLYENRPVSKTAVPNKMYEAIAYDKIFLCSSTGEMNLVKDNPFVFITNLKDDLERIYRICRDKKKRKEVAMKNRALYKKYNFKKFKEILKRKYEELSL